MPSLRAGDLQGRLPVACPYRSIGPAVQEKSNEGEVSVESGLVQRRMATRGAAAVDRTTAGDEKPDDVGAPIWARPGGGGVDRQVAFAVARNREHVRSGVEQRFRGLPVAEVRCEMKGRPAVVGPLSHGSRIVPELSPHVRIEPERASFEEVRASAAIEEQADDVCLPAYVAMRTGELPFSSLAFARSGCAASRSPTAFVSPRRMTPSNSVSPLIGPSAEGVG